MIFEIHTFELTVEAEFVSSTLKVSSPLGKPEELFSSSNLISSKDSIMVLLEEMLVEAFDVCDLGGEG